MPRWKLSVIRWAVSMARRVLPTPPKPATVTTRLSARWRSRRSISSWRPNNVVSGRGKLDRSAALGQRREVTRKARADRLGTAAPVAQALKATSPTATNPYPDATVSATSSRWRATRGFCPPCAIADDARAGSRRRRSSRPSAAPGASPVWIHPNREHDGIGPRFDQQALLESDGRRQRSAAVENAAAKESPAVETPRRRCWQWRGGRSGRGCSMPSPCRLWTAVPEVGGPDDIGEDERHRPDGAVSHGLYYHTSTTVGGPRHGRTELHGHPVGSAGSRLLCPAGSLASRSCEEAMVLQWPVETVLSQRFPCTHGPT